VSDYGVLLAREGIVHTASSPGGCRCQLLLAREGVATRLYRHKPGAVVITASLLIDLANIRGTSAQNFILYKCKFGIIGIR
jgi:hypothetical protein